ncbi:hypothetical protein DCC39_12340 [Pueribacillus theae]|uniref:DUF3231 domain-containing protein n=1 Tax=Pueribacillus theae TaxID=2171751 RepID=A0A2U1JX22_9BACI|nr:DUF3231 family protein [Pueribacillus theae]PWA09747.1 hypothetical protein DCC39_12340 [Pueribacillus theae]
MPSITQMIEAATKVIQSLTDNEKAPLHVGEVMACWTYLAFVGNIITIEEVAMNTVTDTELKQLFTDSLKVALSHKEEISEFMRKEGVVLPVAPERKPNSEPGAIPLGAKFTDDELVNTLNLNFVFASDLCAAAASQCLRTDLGLMFLKFQTEKLSLGFKAKDLMKKRGWLKMPPYYYPPGLPD